MTATTFQCSQCKAPFAPEKGGHCGVCGALFCLRHLQSRKATSVADRSSMQCSVCSRLSSGGSEPAAQARNGA